MTTAHDHVRPFTYRDTGLLIGPLRMERQSYVDTSDATVNVWVYCWNDPGVFERVCAEVDAVVDFDMRHKRPMKD